MPAVEVNAERGITVRSSTNCPAGTFSARRSAFVPASSTSPRTYTGWPQARRILPGRGLGRGQSAERLLPLGAPDLEIDVDDVVVGDGDAPEAVVDVERAELVGGLVVPDDANRSSDDGGAEGARGIGAAELGAAARAVGAAVLADARRRRSTRRSRSGISR